MRHRIGPMMLQTMLALMVAIFLTAAVAGCGGSDGGADEPAAVVSIEEALASADGTSVQVRGYIVATGSTVVLADALLESYPPQAGGAVLPVTGLDLAALVGLSSTEAQPDLTQVSWTEHWVMLEGVITAGTLEVKALPRVIEASTAEAKVRFCLPVEPLVSGEAAWWVFDVTNIADSSIDVTFASGQMGDVVLSQGGVEKYRWSEGKAFDQAIRVDTLESGQTTAYVFNDVVSVAPGDYDVTATVTASIGAVGGAGGAALPELVAKVTVR